MTRARAGWLGGLALASALALACGRGESADAPPPDAAPAAAAAAAADVPAARVVEAQLAAEIAASGSVHALRVTRIAAESPGRLQHVYVDVGDRVEAGTPLFQVDPSSYEMALREAVAGLELARAESRLAADEARRMSLLVAQQAASQQRADQLETQAHVASARAQQMEARVARARHDLERTTVRAPYAGSVVERRADEGSLAGSEPIIVLQEDGELEAVLNVPEASPLPVAPGDAALLVIEGLADPMASRVSRVSRRIDPDTRTYEVHCPVEAVERGAKAGSYVSATLHPQRAEPRPVAPRSALLLREGRSYVLRVAGDRVERVPVRVGVTTDERVELLSGVAPGDLLVSGEAVERLADGERVTPRETPPDVVAAEPQP